jgi:hypothetical protein
MSRFSPKLAIAVLLGALGLGLSSVATADVKWIQTLRHACPVACQQTKDFHPKHPAFNVPYAVPAGIHHKATKARGTPQVFYVCATNFGGWSVGFNIGVIDSRCYTAFLRGGGSYGEYYYCLCSDKPIELIKD